MSSSQQSSLARLVLFMVCLSVAGSVLAGAQYYTVELPQQNALQVPDNGHKPGNKCLICISNCYDKTDKYACLTECDLIC